jgi:hypothetical protein
MGGGERAKIKGGKAGIVTQQGLESLLVLKEPLADNALNTV